jgi:hypothetical protein
MRGLLDGIDGQVARIFPAVEAEIFVLRFDQMVNAILAQIRANGGPRRKPELHRRRRGPLFFILSFPPPKNIDRGQCDLNMPDLAHVFRLD